MRRLVLSVGSIIAIGAMAGTLGGCDSAPPAQTPPVQEAVATPQPADPTKDVRYYNQLAATHIQERQWQQAIDAAQKAISLDAKNQGGWYHMGRALLETWHPDGAVSALQKASDLTGGWNAEIELQLGKALEASGQLVKAASVYQKALERLPGNAQLAQAMEELRPRVTGTWPRLTATADLVKRFREQPDPALLPMVIASLEEFLASSESLSVASASENRLAEFRFPGDAQDGVHVVSFPAGPKSNPLAQNYVWIQWWESGRLRVQRLHAGDPWTVVKWVLLPGPDPRRLIIERKWSDGPGAHAVTLYTLDPSGDQWKPVDAGLQAFPATVGKATVAASASGLVIPGPSTSATLALEDAGQKLTVCDPTASPEVCTTATWNQNQYEIKAESK